MEVQISPAPLFNTGNQRMIRSSPSSSQPFEPISKRFKSDLTFHCIVCSDVYDDPNVLYEHMKSQHHELYDDAAGRSDDENGFESDSGHELSDEEYHDLSRLLEPICELRQVDEDDETQNANFNCQPPNVIAQLMQNNALSGGQMTEEQLRLQIQLQLQLQNHLLQLQTNGGLQQLPNQSDQKENLDQSHGKPLSMRKPEQISFSFNFENVQ